jgi:hypothetical protein
VKTSVEINEEKVKLAKKLGNDHTLRELIDKALDAYIAQARRQGMADMLGTGFFTGDLKTMRQTRGRTRR